MVDAARAAAAAALPPRAVIDWRASASGGRARDPRLAFGALIVAPPRLDGLEAAEAAVAPLDMIEIVAAAAADSLRPLVLLRPGWDGGGALLGSFFGALGASRDGGVDAPPPPHRSAELSTASATAPERLGRGERDAALERAFAAVARAARPAPGRNAPPGPPVFVADALDPRTLAAASALVTVSSDLGLTARLLGAPVIACGAPPYAPVARLARTADALDAALADLDRPAARPVAGDDALGPFVHAYLTERAASLTAPAALSATLARAFSARGWTAG